MAKGQSKKKELEGDWNDFTDRTAIHGFSEYGGVSRSLGAFGRLIWLILICAVAMFCAWQLDSLFKAYIRREPVTVVTSNEKFRYPYISIRMDSGSGLPPSELMSYVRKDLAEATQVEYDKTTTTTTTSATAAAPPDGSDAMAISGFYDEATKNIVVGYQNMIIVPIRYYSEPTDPNPPTGCPIIEEPLGAAKEPFHDMVQKAGGFAAYYAKLMPTTWSDYCPVSLYTGKGPTLYQHKNIRLQPHIQGPQYLFPLPENASMKIESEKKINIALMKEIQLPPYNQAGPKQSYDGMFYINFGTAATNLDTIDSGRKLDTKHEYVMFVALTRFTRSSLYCDQDQTNWGLSCESVCRIREANRTGGCVPGIIGLPHGVRECGPIKLDHDYCKESFKRCVKFCETCTNCQPCDEVSAQVTIEEKKERGSQYAGFGLVDVTFTQQHIQKFAMREQWTTVNFLSQLGGILGLCFGVSIVAVGHATMSAIATFRLLCTGGGG